MKNIHKILVPTDFSELSLSALDYACLIAATQGATIYLLYVVDTIPKVVFPTVDAASETALRDAEADGASKLKYLASKHLNKYPHVVEAMRRGTAYAGIVKFAEDEGIDLIVISTHGRTGLAHVLLGSVAEKVVRHSTVPVLTVKPQELRDEMINEEDVEEQLHLKN
ncbi:MAG: universal stress protein [Ignavibacteriae bacterium]|nr:universal stress protein [Ignavibacteriota bacterium]